MNLIVSGIVDGINEHNSIVNSIIVGADDWTAEISFIASNDQSNSTMSCRFITGFPHWNSI